MKYQPPADGLHQEVYPDGKQRAEYTLKNGRRHGAMRMWHENGQLAQECRFVDGLAEGGWRHWNALGELLGVDYFKAGTGIGHLWHENGNVSAEFSYVRGEMTGRMRYWERDGMLYGAKYFFQGRPISKKKYQALCDTDNSLPRFSDEKPSNTFGNHLRKLRKERRERVKLGPTPEQIQTIKNWDNGCERETKEADSCEAIMWLTKKKRSVRELGEMSKKQALNLVRKLYSAGAVRVWALRIEEDGDGASYSKQLLIRLPKDPKQTGEFHKLCADSARPRLDGSGPAIKVGQKFMTVSLL